MDSKNFQVMVRAVSRSFSLTLNGLPHPQRNSIAVCYMLARLADTISDSGTWTNDKRAAYLGLLEVAILQQNPKLFTLTDQVGGFKESEAHLLLEAENLLKYFFSFDEFDVVAGQEVLKILIQGMKWDLKNFSNSSQSPFAVKDAATFDWYCYSIAGCVGAYWTKIFKLPQTLEPLAIAYGKGLQRINILRDVVADWKRGRVYLPTSELEKFNLHQPQYWLHPNWKKFTEKYIAETQQFLLHGAQFCDALPYASFRLRYASALPLEIGRATLAKIASTSGWQDEIKITRPEVKKLAFSTLWKVFLGRKFSKTK